VSATPPERRPAAVEGAALPAALRRTANGVLALTVVSLPLSTSGMQIGIAGLGALALVAHSAGWPVLCRTPLDGALVVFFAALAVSTLVSGHPLEATGWSRLWVVVGYFGVYWWVTDRRHAQRLALLLVAAGAVAAAYGILQHHTGVDWYREALGRPTRVRPRIEGAAGFAVVGFFRNYLTYAHTMVFPLCFAATFALRGMWLAAGAAILCASAIAYATARGVWLGLVGAALLLVAIGRLRAVAYVSALAAVVATVIMCSPGLRAQVEPIWTLGGANAGRMAIYGANLDIIHDHPVFGLGFGRYRVAARPYYRVWPAADRRSHAHSNLFHIGAEAGLLGVAAFCFLFAVLLRRGWDALAAASDDGVRATAAGAWLGIWAFLIAGLTQYNFGDNEVATAMWVTAALLMRCRTDDP